LVMLRANMGICFIRFSFGFPASCFLFLSIFSRDIPATRWVSDFAAYANAEMTGCQNFFRGLSVSLVFVPRDSAWKCVCLFRFFFVFRARSLVAGDHLLSGSGHAINSVRGCDNRFSCSSSRSGLIDRIMSSNLRQPFKDVRQDRDWEKRIGGSVRKTLRSCKRQDINGRCDERR
jgi:hypothetical protein